MSRFCAQGQVHQNDLINSGLETTRTWLLRFISFSFAVMLSVGCYFNWIYAFSHLGRKQGSFFHTCILSLLLHGSQLLKVTIHLLRTKIN